MLACFCARVFACVVSSREWAEADMSKCTQKSAAKETETCARPPALARERMRSEWAPFDRIHMPWVRTGCPKREVLCRRVPFG
jgi:hypothetical protein